VNVKSDNKHNDRFITAEFCSIKYHHKLKNQLKTRQLFIDLTQILLNLLVLALLVKEHGK
jgi:hypothetical protein